MDEIKMIFSGENLKVLYEEFSESEVEEIFARMECGESFDSAVQSVM